MGQNHCNLACVLNRTCGAKTLGIKETMEDREYFELNFHLILEIHGSEAEISRVEPESKKFGGRASSNLVLLGKQN